MQEFGSRTDVSFRLRELAELARLTDLSNI